VTDPVPFLRMSSEPLVRRAADVIEELRAVEARLLSVAVIEACARAQYAVEREVTEAAWDEAISLAKDEYRKSAEEGLRAALAAARAER